MFSCELWDTTSGTEVLAHEAQGLVEMFFETLSFVWMVSIPRWDVEAPVFPCPQTCSSYRMRESLLPSAPPPTHFPLGEALLYLLVPVILTVLSASLAADCTFSRVHPSSYEEKLSARAAGKKRQTLLSSYFILWERLLQPWSLLITWLFKFTVPLVF